MTIAEYHCPVCGYRFEGLSGPTTCPACSGLYVRWTNYDDLEALGVFGDARVGRDRGHWERIRRAIRRMT